jgi:phosphoglycolate phosphatase
VNKKLFNTIIFDLDGTLLDTARDVQKCSNIVLKQMGLRTLSLEDAKLSIGPGADNFAKVTLGENNVHRFKEFIRKYRDIYQHECLEYTKPFPGVLELLERLHDKHLLVATNKPTIYSNHILSELRILEYFDMVIGPGDVERPKPYPDMIELGIRRSAGAAESTVMVGDTDNDILAAQAAGVEVCAVAWGYGPLEILHKFNPNYIVNNANELYKVLNGSS